MTWIFVSKNGSDRYVNMFANSVGAKPTVDFCYQDSNKPIVLRGILKHKVIRQCWQDRRDFYYIDSGYFGNQPSGANPKGHKIWHRIVKNNLQHSDIVPRPSDRWQKHKISLHSRRHGSKIIVAAPDEKPCRFYGIDQKTWVDQTVASLRQHTDRPIVVRQRAAQRIDRTHTNPLSAVLTQDVHALVTYNSVAAVESVMLGVPAFTLAPVNAASPVTSQNLSEIESPTWPDKDLIYAWACHLAYGQFSVAEICNGTAYRILNAG